jgi:BirA family biotin operon repressor/biotin-[acetyl-CoA-carboxylase] ligase
VKSQGGSVSNRLVRRESGKGNLLRDTDFDEERFETVLATQWLGRRLLYRRSVKSTQDLATAVALDGAASGTLVLADEQTEGRGRKGRSWVSPEGGIWSSLVLRLGIHPERIPWLLNSTSVGLAETMDDLYELTARMKWPNDVLAKGRKIAGVLLDSTSQGGRLIHAIVGMGVNLNVERESFPDTLRDSATSVRAETGKAVDTCRFLAALLLRLEEFYELVEANNLDAIRRKWEKRSDIVGDTISLGTRHNRRQGVVLGLGARGGLRIELSEGDEVEIFDW